MPVALIKGGRIYANPAFTEQFGPIETRITSDYITSPNDAILSLNRKKAWNDKITKWNHLGIFKTRQTFLKKGRSNRFFVNFVLDLLIYIWKWIDFTNPIEELFRGTNNQRLVFNIDSINNTTYS